jgi:hypothetical protein
MDDFLKFLKDYGPWALLAGYLIVQLINDKARLVTRSETNEDRYIALAERSVAALENNTSANHELSMALVQLASALRIKPCMLDEETLQELQRELQKKIKG